jgi:Flp pilus assembly protein TadD
MKRESSYLLKRGLGLLFLFLGGLLAGCSSVPSEPAISSDFSSLGDADAHLTYSTAFPIASAQEGVLRGDAAWAKGDLNRALFEYIRVLDKDGANGETLYRIARLHLERKDMERARLALLFCLKEIPDHFGALLEMGKLEMHRRRYAAAETLLTKALRIAPDSAEIYNTLGILEDMQKRHYEAQTLYLRAIDIDGNKPSYLNNLGYSYYLIGCEVRAEQMFLDTLKAYPEYTLAWRNLGLIYAKNARFEQALEALSKTVKEYQAYNDVGYVAMLSGHYDVARNYFNEALRLSPSYYELAAQNAKHLAVLRSKGGAH